MTEEGEAEAEIVIEGGMLGVKRAQFLPLVNFSFEILHSWTIPILVNFFKYFFFNETLLVGIYNCALIVMIVLLDFFSMPEELH